MIAVVDLTIAVIVVGKIDYLLWPGQDLFKKREIVVVVVVEIKNFSVLRELGRVSK
jgi:hypothetical protein